MSDTPFGDLKGLSQSQKKAITKLFSRRISSNEMLTNDLGREIYELAESIGRRIGVFIDRDGIVIEVIVGEKDIMYLPNLKRYREGKSRLRKYRLIFSDITRTQEKVTIPSDIITDLEKLRLDMVCAVKIIRNQLTVSYAWNIPFEDVEKRPIEVVLNKLFSSVDLDFSSWINDLDTELISKAVTHHSTDKTPAMIVGVYPKNHKNIDVAMDEIRELARTADIEIVDKVIQNRNPDPKTLIGKGKLEEVVLRAIRFDVEMLIFDSELSPSQWRAITNATDLKIIDRSMLILDIFAQHAKTHDGKLQVELAQLKYNLPKLVEKDVGLSRLTGGIGGRGPGETKLEVSRRYYRDRISDLEKQIDKLGKQRALRRKKREGIPIPLVALVGYTNVGKSSLFNAMTKSDVIVENKLFATLDPTQRRLFLQHPEEADEYFYKSQSILIDTVGFIRELPKELVNAFRATLEEIDNATILLHVLDASDPEVKLRHQSVVKQLRDFEMGDIPVVNVLNKCDLVDSEKIEDLKSEFNAIAVSAVNRDNFKEIINSIKESLDTKR